ncbi:MAG: hypothetical protein IJ309_02315 [Clostridia bacterium]|nr:hypothetical protein [Clostridia bacterium]
MVNFDTIKKCDFEGDIKKVELFDNAYSMLSGKSLEEQAEHLFLIEDEDFEEFSYGQSDSRKCANRLIPIKKSDWVNGLFLHKGIIVGVLINRRTVLLGQCVETYYAVDEDGTGRESVSLYHTLVLK